MPTLSDLVRAHTGLSDAELEWLHSLVSDWQLLADLSFADLILWTGTRGGGWVAVAQMRPTTGPTAQHDDLVGTVVPARARPMLEVARTQGRICREGDPEWTGGIPVREESIPVRREGKIIAVIQRSTNLNSARTPSRLELTYLQSADVLSQMIADGRFPYSGEEPLLVRSPRVGDGLLRVDRAGKVTYASPNALSAYRRLGHAVDLVGAELGPVTAGLCTPGEPVDESLVVVASGRAPRESEVEGNGSVVQLRAIPLIADGTRSGALLLVRDVTELRRRERELITKDATIREIHHRVKNNLQTVAALLRLQARRIRVPEGRDALEEAVRRVGSIAIVHETLSHTPEEIVDFDDIAGRVVTMAGEVSSPDARVTPSLSGRFGLLPAYIATPLAMVLTELLQNALQHGIGPQQGKIRVTVTRPVDRLAVVVADSGSGFPDDFDLESSSSLGLQIVRTLVVGELGGRLEISRGGSGGTEVLVDLPVPVLAANGGPGGPPSADDRPAEARSAEARPGDVPRGDVRPGEAGAGEPGPRDAGPGERSPGGARPENGEWRPAAGD